jgi:hypothetical protein
LGIEGLDDGAFLQVARLLLAPNNGGLGANLELVLDLAAGQALCSGKRKT